MTSLERVNPISASPPLAAFALVNAGDLLPHEHVDPVRLRELRERLTRDRILYRPVIVDRESRVILDGHHRVKLLGEFECALVPVYMVDYPHPSIRVFARRPGITVDKLTVVRRGLRGDPFPPRTSRHVFATPPPLRPTPLSVLEGNA
ncbi:MAG: transcriptional regulator [Clostridia bacterium]